MLFICLWVCVLPVRSLTQWKFCRFLCVLTFKKMQIYWVNRISLILRRFKTCCAHSVPLWYSAPKLAHILCTLFSIPNYLFSFYLVVMAAFVQLESSLCILYKAIISIPHSTMDKQCGKKLKCSVFWFGFFIYVCVGLFGRNVRRTMRITIKR